jgi:hypothetical protein
LKKIFQIGFNRCGTVSMHEYFLSNGIKSAHWMKGTLAKQIFQNKSNGRPLISGLEAYEAYTDMELVNRNNMLYVAPELFKELYEENPQSLFIFNDRNMQAWINSRNNHGDYVEQVKAYLNVNSIQEVHKIWIDDYKTHKRNVLEFFSGKDNFLHYKIDEDSNEILGNFLSEHGYNISNSLVEHTHRTKTSELDKEIDLIRDAAISFEKYDLTISKVLMEKAAELRPNGGHIKKKLLDYQSKIK